MVLLICQKHKCCNNIVSSQPNAYFNIPMPSFTDRIRVAAILSCFVKQHRYTSDLWTRIPIYVQILGPCNTRDLWSVVD